MNYKEVFQTLVNIGLLDVILPFILVFSIVYGTLERTKIFGRGKDKTKINAMVAFVVGFSAVLATNVIKTINIIVTYLTLALLTTPLLAILFGLAGMETNKKNKAY